jgi:23S rRNA (guanosine2251-2'-O)-methyltransferase
VEEALRREKTRVSKVFLSSRLKGPVAGEIEALARKKGIPVQRMHEEDLERRSQGAAHQGIVAEVFVRPPLGLKEFFEGLEEKPGPVILLDGIEDPQNLGAILRSAAFFGASGVIIPRRRSAHPTSLVAKISAGALEYVPVIEVANIAETIEVLKKQGFWVAGADPQGEKGPEALSGKVALVMGAEGAGLGRLVKERCDFLVRIPSGAKTAPASLNASCAAAVLLYAATVSPG